MEDWIEPIKEKAKMVSSEGLCDRCLGRMFGKIGTNMTNDVRGKLIREAIGEKSVTSGCPLCEDSFDMLDRYADAVSDAVNEVDSDNFLVGSKVDPEILKKEKELTEKYCLENSESIKTEFNREIGKIAIMKINRPVEFKNPQVVACIDTRFAEVELELSPIFIYGRYNKFSREIPQTIWPCRVCHGKGCPRCGNTGKMYQTSVQEIIGDIALKMAKGEEHFFHGMGREDIDALMLGDGRPFVLEISKPRVRSIDLDELEKLANQSELAQFHYLRFVNRNEVQKTKLATPSKTYRALVRVQGNINKEEVNSAVASFKNVSLDQRTPQRVEHRRADLVRKRTVLWAKADNVCEDSFELTLETESGTYVKEFVSGDEGRTQPNLSQALGKQCKVERLDVIAINTRE